MNKPLKVSYTVHGGMGTETATRVLLPADVFLVNEKPSFPHATREMPVDYRYAFVTRDAMRIAYPAGFSLETAPTAATERYQNDAIYTMGSKVAENTVTVSRNLSVGSVLIPQKEYADWRGFYAKLKADDQSKIVLKSSEAKGSQ